MYPLSYGVTPISIVMRSWPRLSLDSYSGAPRGPRASSGPLLGLQSKVTNFMIQGSISDFRVLNRIESGCGSVWEFSDRDRASRRPRRRPPRRAAPAARGAPPTGPWTPPPRGLHISAYQRLCVVSRRHARSILYRLSIWRILSVSDLASQLITSHMQRVCPARRKRKWKSAPSASLSVLILQRSDSPLGVGPRGSPREPSQSPRPAAIGK